MNAFGNRCRVSSARPTPDRRLLCDDGLSYRYSGTVNVARPWTPTLLNIKEQIEAVQGRYNFCLLNRYRSGQDSMGMHADNEPEMGQVIGSLSLGATRTFRIKHNKTKETMSFAVGNGTLDHHGGDDAALLETLDSKDEEASRRAHQPDIQADHPGVTIKKNQLDHRASCPGRRR